MKKGKILVTVFLVLIALLSSLVISCWEFSSDCTSCDGSGKCSLCKGEGKYVLYHSNLGTEYRDCTNCNKTGKCKTCDGSGKNK